MTASLSAIEFASTLPPTGRENFENPLRHPSQNLRVFRWRRGCEGLCQPMLYLVCQQQERGTLLSQFPRRSSPSVALRHSTPVKILLPRLLPFFFVGSGFVPGIELPVQHGVELLLQALPDFFFKIILAPQMVHGEVDEQIIGDLYAFHFPILSYPRRSQRLRRLL